MLILVFFVLISFTIGRVARPSPSVVVFRPPPLLIGAVVGLDFFLNVSPKFSLFSAGLARHSGWTHDE
jgi:hypothetical protein